MMAQRSTGNMPAVENGRERVYVNHQSHFVDPTVNHNHNKNLDMHVIEERERERWGGTHAPPSPPQVHDAPVWQHSMGGYETGDVHEYQSMHELDSKGMYDSYDPYVHNIDAQGNESDLGEYR